MNNTFFHSCLVLIILAVHPCIDACLVSLCSIIPVLGGFENDSLLLIFFANIVCPQMDLLSFFLALIYSISYHENMVLKIDQLIWGIERWRPMFILKFQYWENWRLTTHPLEGAVGSSRAASRNHWAMEAHNSNPEHWVLSREAMVTIFTVFGVTQLRSQPTNRSHSSTGLQHFKRHITFYAAHVLWSRLPIIKALNKFQFGQFYCNKDFSYTRARSDLILQLWAVTCIDKKIQWKWLKREEKRDLNKLYLTCGLYFP